MASGPGCDYLSTPYGYVPGGNTEAQYFPQCKRVPTAQTFRMLVVSGKILLVSPPLPLFFIDGNFIQMGTLHI